VSDLTAKAARHQMDLEKNVAFFSVQTLATRWGCSTPTVRAIPSTALPYLNLGHGLQRELRRYRPEDVYAYESKRLEKTG